MRIFLLVLSAVLGVTTAAPMATTVVERPSVYITVRPAGDGADVLYDLTVPVSTLALGHQAPAQVGAGWQLVDAPDLLIAKGVVRSISGKPFQSFKLHLKPDMGSSEVHTIGLARFGNDTIGVYLGALLPNMDQVDTHLCVEDRPGVCADRQAEPGYFQLRASGWIDDVTLGEAPVVVIGKRPFMEERGFRTLYADGIPAGVRDTINAAVRKELRFYSEHLGLDLEEEPTVMVTAVEGGAPTWMLRPYLFSTIHIELTDVTDETPLPQQFQEELILALDQALAALHAQYAFRTGETSSQHWFYGGVMRYWAQASELQVFGSAGTAAKLLGASVEACKAAPSAYNTPLFSCGEMVQWLADAQVRRRSGGTATLIDLWQETLGATPLADNKLDIALFEAHLKKYDPDGYFAALMADFKAGRPLNAALLNRALLAIGRKDLVSDAD